MICPFCLHSHDDTTTKCPNKETVISPEYIRNVKRGIPCVPFFLIGYRGHGKTCFLSSLFYSMKNIIPKKWSSSRAPLDQETLNRIEKDYVEPLEKGLVPQATGSMFPIPFVLKLQKMPLTRRRLFKSPIIEEGEVNFIFYDIGGEVSKVAEEIKEKLPMINEVKTVTFLINLPWTIEGKVEDPMGTMAENIFLTMGGNTKGKNAIVCFSSAHLMWNNKDIYGALSTKISYDDIPSFDELPIYFKKSKEHSNKIKEHIRENYSHFHNFLNNNFKSVYFTTLSPLGSEAKNGEIHYLAPWNIINPILWLLRSEGYL